MEILAKRLKELRTARGLTLSEAARGAGLTPQAYSRYEKGLRKRGFAALLRLASFYKVTPDYLLGFC